VGSDSGLPFFKQCAF
jgi:hypothetical protein